jgi:PPE-repeat protein
MDFGALPPEINSGRMYSGPGSGPLRAAAAAWKGLGAEWGSTASSYGSVISGLTAGPWSGPSSVAMAAAATPYVAWMRTTAARAEQAAVQAAAAATAYETAFAATVPPPVIAANRSLWMSLIATNILGQNTPAIAATDAHYSEMWAQDAAAMYGYAGSSPSSTELTPFTAPPSTTNPAGLGAQAGAVSQAVGANTQTTLSQLMAAVPQALQGFASSAPAAATQAESPLLSLLDALSGPLSPVSLYGIGGVPFLLALQSVLLPINSSNVIVALSRAEKMTAEGQWPPNPFDLGALNPVDADVGPRLVGSPGVGESPVLAGLGNAGSVGKLSVPQGWSAAAPEVKPMAVALPGAASGAAASVVAADSESGLLGELGLGGLAGRAIGATGGAASRGSGRTRGKTKEGKPSTATIIVIPPSVED